LLEENFKPLIFKHFQIRPVIFPIAYQQVNELLVDALFSPDQNPNTSSDSQHLTNKINIFGKLIQTVVVRQVKAI